MKSKLHVAVSPLTNTIYCGSVTQDGKGWLSNRTDVTGEACGAVAEYVTENGKPVTVTINGEDAYRISVEDLRAKKE